MRKMLLLLFLLIFSGLVWIFAPISKEQYISFRPVEIKLSGLSFFIETVAEDKGSSDKMSGTIFMRYPNSTISERSCSLKASFFIEGMDTKRPKNLVYPNWHVTECSTEEPDCLTKENGMNERRMHLHFSNVPIEDIALTLEMYENPSLQNQKCSHATQKVYMKPRWRRVSKWDYWSSI